MQRTSNQSTNYTQTQEGKTKSQIQTSAELEKLKQKCEEDPTLVCFQDMVGLAAESCRD